MPVATDPLRGPRPDDEPRAAGPPVVVTGADTALGREVVARLREAGPVVALGAGGGAGGRSVDLATADLKPLFEGAEVVVHVGTPSGAALDEASAAASADVAIAQRVLDAAGDVDAAHVVVLSSATVYGAWANNAMPLTEDATLRPVPELALAVQRAEIERRVAEWRQAHPGKTATVLRPVPVVGGDAASDGLARALHAARRVADIEGDPPAQFLHVDDLAAAIALAAVVRIDGARNVAPDGWLRGAEYTALDAGTPREDGGAADAAGRAWPVVVTTRVVPIAAGILGVVLLVLGGWLIRAGLGWTGRANSTLIAGDPGLPITDALTAVEAVDMIVTEMGVIEVSPQGFVLTEIYPAYSVEDVVQATGAELKIPGHILRMKGQ